VGSNSWGEFLPSLPTPGHLNSGVMRCQRND